MQNSLKKFRMVVFPTLLAMATFSVALHARAEGPMNTDDAGTLDRGGIKIEAIWSHDDQTRGAELIGGWGLWDKLEVELVGLHLRDHTEYPATKLQGMGFGAKWVPYQNEKGWSAGLRFDYGRTHIQQPAPTSKRTEKEYAITGLASYRFHQAQVLHLNLGAVHTKTSGESETLVHWSLGYEYPLLPQWQGTIEIFGAEKNSPDKALGLRYEIQDGLKVYGAIGRGNDRNFGSLGFAWEF